MEIASGNEVSWPRLAVRKNSITLHAISTYSIKLQRDLTLAQNVTKKRPGEPRCFITRNLRDVKTSIDQSYDDALTAWVS